MLAAGDVIHVFTDIPILSKRLNRKAGTRPLLKGKNVLETINATWLARRDFYQMAHFQFDSSTHSLNDLIAMLKNKKGS